MGQTITKTVDRLEKTITTHLDNNITPSAVDLNQRLEKCMVSYNQLLLDVKRLNYNYSKHFISPTTNKILKFTLYSKLPQSQLNNKWKYQDNIIVTATQIDYTNNINDIAATNPSLPSHVLTLKEFYYIFIYMCDNHQQLAIARDKLRRKNKTNNNNTSSDNENDNKHEDNNPTTTTTKTGDNETKQSDNECSICLSNEVEIALVCLHSFCRECILDWNNNSSECPLCREKVDVNNQENWDIITSDSETELQEQIHTTSAFVHDYVQKRPLFQKKNQQHAALPVNRKESNPNNNNIVPNNNPNNMIKNVNNVSNAVPVPQPSAPLLSDLSQTHQPNSQSNSSTQQPVVYLSLSNSPNSNHLNNVNNNNNINATSKQKKA